MNLVAGGGHSALGLCVGFARLTATRLLPHGLESQVAGDRAAGGLGRVSVFWGPQHCSQERESGLPEKEACPLGTLGSVGGTGVVRDGFSRVPCTSAGAGTGSRTPTAGVIVVGGHARAPGGDGWDAVACPLVEISGDPSRPRCRIGGGGTGRGTRTQSPLAEETVRGLSTTEASAGPLSFVYAFM